LNFLLSGQSNDKTSQLHVRLAGDRLSHRVNRQSDFIEGTLPTSNDIFESLLRSKEYQVRTTDKCRYAEGLSNLIGGLEELKIWRDQGTRDLFYKMQYGAVYTPQEMLSFMKLSSKSKAYQLAAAMLTDLSVKGILLRGYKIQCPVCDLTRWYGVAEITEVMQCAGCLAKIQPSIEAPFHYKLNELAARGVNQGSIPVILTMLVLHTLARTSFMFVPGLVVQKTREVDLDIVASCDGHLILAECKDLREGASSETIKSVTSQFTDLVDVAIDVGASVVFLSVLADNVPSKLQRHVEALSKRFKNTIGVHLLSAAELQKGYKSKSLGEFLSLYDPDKETVSTLQDFLPQPQSYPSGWVREVGERHISF
jgi:hypothetical protein